MSLPSKPKKLNVIGGYNGVGFVILALVLVFGVAASRATNRRGEHVNMSGFIAVFIALALGFLLATNRVVVDPERRTIIVRQGLWPFVFGKSVSYGASAEIVFDYVQGKYGPLYRAFLRLSAGEDEGRVALLRGGDENGLQRMLEFASELDMPVHLDPKLRARAPQWLLRKVSE